MISTMNMNTSPNMRIYTHKCSSATVWKVHEMRMQTYTAFIKVLQLSKFRQQRLLGKPLLYLMTN